MVLLPLWWDVTSVTGLALARDSMMTVLEGEAVVSLEGFDCGGSSERRAMAVRYEEKDV